MLMNDFLIKNNTITLLKYSDKYYHQTYELFSLYKGKGLIRYTEKFFHRLNFYSNFKSNMKRKYYDVFLIQEIYNFDIIGFLYMYNYEPENRTIFFDIFVKNNRFNEKLLKDLVKEYLKALNDKNTIRAIYSHCYENEEYKKEFLIKCSFKCIGKMHEYRYFNNKYIDVEILELNL